MGKLYNLARMTTATTGTGTITLGSAKTGFLSFATAGVQNGDVVSYGITDGANSEVGTGTYTSSGTTLTRTVVKSTNSDAAINLSGSAEVFITALAADIETAASTSAAGLIEIATDAEVNTGSSTTLALTPSNVKTHQTVAKMWNNAADSGTVSSTDGYNVSSMTDHGTGDYTTTYTTALANTNYTNFGWATAGASGFLFHWYQTASNKATSSVRFGHYYLSDLLGGGTLRNAGITNTIVFGDSA